MHDEIFEECRKRYQLTFEFLKAMKKNLPEAEAFKVAEEAFAGFMTGNYQEVLKDTEPGSQERFDKFRKHYEQAAELRPYLTVVKSEPGELKVCYDRCPFAEVADSYGLEDMVSAFCLSDGAFTEAVLPGVRFERENEIARGERICDHMWKYTKKEG
ncbi:MAG: L-2-amino-thiazoline-4-carboxylic acid hydrolase [Candidatus Margulisiibacteriota bacterium]